MQSPDIKKVEVRSDYELLLTFANSEVKLFDIKPYLKPPIFNPIIDKDEFLDYSIVDGTIEWKCGADLSQDTYYLGGKSVDEEKMKEM